MPAAAAAAAAVAVVDLVAVVVAVERLHQRLALNSQALLEQPQQVPVAVVEPRA